MVLLPLVSVVGAKSEEQERMMQAFAQFAGLSKITYTGSAYVLGGQITLLSGEGVITGFLKVDYGQGGCNEGELPTYQDVLNSTKPCDASA